jgi:hypothetical protein
MIQDAGSTASHQATIAHGEVGIRQVGPRAYVGGLWQEIGRLQFDFLVSQGLRPEHYLLDVGCGCLRGGVHFIAFLRPGHYLGLEKEPLLLEAGFQELGPELWRQKRPRLHQAADFDATVFGIPIHYALAQSVFTHLPARMILACLRRLRPAMRRGGLFFATFFEAAQPQDNPSQPHDHGYFAYTRHELVSLGRQAGWQPELQGAWGHPRGQQMMQFRAEP